MTYFEIMIVLLFTVTEQTNYLVICTFIRNHQMYKHIQTRGISSPILIPFLQLITEIHDSHWTQPFWMSILSKGNERLFEYEKAYHDPHWGETIQLSLL